MEKTIFFQVAKNPRITLDDFRIVLEHFPCFEQAPIRTGVNPFTKEKVSSTGVEAAIYRCDGKVSGNLCLEDGRILCTGVLESICREVAALIGASSKPWDNS